MADGVGSKQEKGPRGCRSKGRGMIHTTRDCHLKLAATLLVRPAGAQARFGDRISSVPPDALNPRMIRAGPPLSCWCTGVVRDGVKAFHFRKKSPVAVLAAETVARDRPQDHSQESQNANEIGHGAGTSDWRKVFGKKPPNKARCH